MGRTEPEVALYALDGALFHRADLRTTSHLLLVDMAVFGPWVKNVWQDPSITATAKPAKKPPRKRPKAKPAPRPTKAGL